MKSGLCMHAALVLFFCQDREVLIRDGEVFPSLLSGSVNTQAPWEGHSSSRGTPFFVTDRWISLDHLEEPHCLNNENDGVLLRHRIIIVFYPGNFWIFTFIYSLSFFSATFPSDVCIQAKCNKEPFYVLLWP